MIESSVAVQIKSAKAVLFAVCVSERLHREASHRFPRQFQVRTKASLVVVRRMYVQVWQVGPKGCPQTSRRILKAKKRVNHPGGEKQGKQKWGCLIC